MVSNSFNEVGMAAIGNVEMPVDMIPGGPMTSESACSGTCYTIDC